MADGFIVRKGGGGGGQFGSDIEAGLITMYYGLDTQIPFGWDLCDGTKGNPDLRNLFIIGAGGNYTVESTGGSTDAVVVSHTHTGTVSTDGNHTHGINLGSSTSKSSQGLQGGSSSSFNLNSNAGNSSHSHSLTLETVGESNTNKNLPPYYGLYYIIKLEEA